MIEDTKHRAILLFVRYPIKGKVKTRLETHLSQDEILSLYKCFVEDILASLRKCGFPVTICFLPPERETEMKAWLGAASAYVPQTGKDLGQRMLNAFMQAFTSETSPVDRAILIGSDVPDLDPGILDQAFDCLSNNDMALGPANDGGYYLIGAANGIPDVFEQIAWGSDKVLEQTVERLERSDTRFALLPPWYDVDDRQSLVRLSRELSESSGHDRHLDVLREEVGLIETADRH